MQIVEEVCTSFFSPSSLRNSLLSGISFTKDHGLSDLVISLLINSKNNSQSSSNPTLQMYLILGKLSSRFWEQLRVQVFQKEGCYSLRDFSRCLTQSRCSISIWTHGPDFPGSSVLQLVLCRALIPHLLLNWWFWGAGSGNTLVLHPL